MKVEVTVILEIDTDNYEYCEKILQEMDYDFNGRACRRYGI